MSMYRKLMTFGCAAVLALGLAACGGGGDDDTAQAPAVTDPPGPSQEDLDSANERADAAEDALAAEQSAAQAASLRQLSTAITNFMIGATDVTRRNLDADIAYSVGTGRFTVTNTVIDNDATAVAPAPVAGGLTAPRLSAAAAPEDAGMWSGQTQTRRVTGGETDTVTFYTDQGLRMGPPLDSLLTATRLAETASQVALVADDAPRIRGDDFAVSGTKNHVAPGTVPSATRPVMVSGTYAGVSGTYLCSSATCTSMPAATGGVTLGTGDTWHFQPDDRNARTEPADYRYFGWWLRENAAGTMLVGTFSGNTGTDATTNYVPITGTASYAGAAAGKATLAPALGEIEGGHFTADVALSANFSRETISGTVDNFVVDGAETDWTVTLRDATIADRAGGDNDFSRGAGGTFWTIGGVRARPGGSWQGRFHDPSPATAPDNGTPRQATGEFQATYGGAGRMVGAFGAHKE